MALRHTLRSITTSGPGRIAAGNAAAAVGVPLALSPAAAHAATTPLLYGTMPFADYAAAIAG
jgi:hypothetical protein